MVVIQREEIELIEYEEVFVERDYLSPEEGEFIWNNYGKQISVNFPSPVTEGQWGFTNQGWAGYIPVNKGLLFNLRPKVPIQNIFRMLEYAWDLLKLIPSRHDYIQCNNLKDFFNLLAKLLADKILQRGRRGYLKSYQDEYRRLSYISGRLDLNEHMKTPWNPYFYCHYQECTPDIEDNQILLWTLYIIIHSGICNAETLRVVHQAFRSLHKMVQLQPFRSKDCLNRSYHRLNLDYQPMHNLCWFFLEYSGPQIIKGEHRMIPFTLYLPTLFEAFVARWLKENLPVELDIKEQEKVYLGENGEIKFVIDIVIYDHYTGKALYVLDTKYKLDEKMSSGDFAQVATYALAKDCMDAALVYPGDAGHEMDAVIKGIRVRYLSFPLDGDLNEAGERFLNNLLEKKQFSKYYSLGSLKQLNL